MSSEAPGTPATADVPTAVIDVTDVVAGYAERPNADVTGLLAYLDAAAAVENGLAPAEVSSRHDQPATPPDSLGLRSTSHAGTTCGARPIAWYTPSPTTCPA